MSTLSCSIALRQSWMRRMHKLTRRRKMFAESSHRPSLFRSRHRLWTSKYSANSSIENKLIYSTISNLRWISMVISALKEMSSFKVAIRDPWSMVSIKSMWNSTCVVLVARALKQRWQEMQAHVCSTSNASSATPPGPARISRKASTLLDAVKDVQPDKSDTKIKFIIHYLSKTTR